MTTKPLSKRDRLWPFNELETLCLAAITWNFVMFGLGYALGVSGGR